MKIMNRGSWFVKRLPTWLASALLTASLLGVFAVVGHIERWGVEFDDDSALSTQHSALSTEYHRIAVDISACTPPRWISVTPILEITIEVSSDLGWTAVGCTRFAYQLATPIPTRRLIQADATPSSLIPHPSSLGPPPSALARSAP